MKTKCYSKKETEVLKKAIRILGERIDRVKLREMILEIEYERGRNTRGYNRETL